ncbi:MAG TPA: lipoprotein [Acetobacteraceae bacterium]|nr:lipoprotein [Acetobacteraceae bacterium]
MKRIVTVITSLALLAGCGANPATQAQLNANNAACAAGDPDACTAARYTAQQAAAEAQQNTNALVTGLAALGAAAGTAALVNSNNNHPTYYPPPYPYHR